MKKNYKYEIIENPFHGSVHIAYAVSLETAVRSVRRHDCCTGKYCVCGGPVIQNADGTSLCEEDLINILLIKEAMRNQ